MLGFALAQLEVLRDKSQGADRLVVEQQKHLLERDAKLSEASDEVQTRSPFFFLPRALPLRCPPFTTHLPAFFASCCFLDGTQIRRVTAKLQAVESAKEIAVASERRLADDNLRLRAENKQMNNLLESLQRIEAGINTQKMQEVRCRRSRCSSSCSPFFILFW